MIQEMCGRIGLVTGKGLVYSIRHITTAADAATALASLAGPAASLLFALGIVGAGLLAVPVLAGSASYALAETFDVKTEF